MKTRFLSLMALAALTAFWMAQPVLAAGTDELWEISQKMEGMPDLPGGMAMGGMTTKSCMAKEEMKAPVDQKCKVISQTRKGDTMKFKVSCPDGEMEGEMTRTATSIKGRMTMKTKGEGPMTMTLSGKKVGSCDAKAERAKQEKMVAGAKKEIAKSLADSAKAQDENCRKGAKDGFYVDYVYPTSACAKYKKEYCKAITTMPGYQQLTENLNLQRKDPNFFKQSVMLHQMAKDTKPLNNEDAVGQACGIKNLAGQLCQESVAKQNYGFMKNHCAADYKKEMAQGPSLCANYDFTGAGTKMSNRTYKLCSEYVSTRSDEDSGQDAVNASPAPSPAPSRASGNAPAAPKDAAKNAAKEAGADAAKQALKGVFGF